MKYKLSITRSIRWLRASAACTAAVLALGWVAAASAGTVTDNKSCRKQIATQLTGVVTKGMSDQESCYAKSAAANVSSEVCVDPTSFAFTIIDNGAYQKKQSTAETKLISSTTPPPKCPGVNAAETLDNYPNNDTAAAYDAFDSLLDASAGYIVGQAALSDPVAVKCRKQIAASRHAVAAAMLNKAVGCQKKADLTASLAQFNALLPSCLDDTTLAGKITVENNKITKKCGTAPNVISGYPSGSAAGACSPLPGCVTSAALALGKNLALAEYPSQTCTGTAPDTKTKRTLAVTLHVPPGSTLGGVDVRVAYPRFQTGIAGNGQEGTVISAITGTPSGAIAQPTDKDGQLDVSMAFTTPFSGGAAFTATLDQCDDLDTATCSVHTGVNCDASKDCASHCRERANGGTADNTNTPCWSNDDCPPPSGSLVQECVCSHGGCQQKRCVGPNLDLTQNAPCNYNQDCAGRCDNKKFVTTGGTCNFDSQCIAGGGTACLFTKACNTDAQRLCATDTDCHQGGVCNAASADPGKPCTADNAAAKCTGGACDFTTPVAGLCNIGDPNNGGGFCTNVEQCQSRTSHCSISQNIACFDAGDCPAGETCEPQSALTVCTVLSALDETGTNEVDGVTCTMTVTEAP